MLKVLIFLSVFLVSNSFADTKGYKRIVSVGGSVTEIIFALGAGEKIVGTDVSSSYPQEVANLPKLGYYRALSTEGVLSLKPDLIILSEDSGPQNIVEQLKTTGIPLVFVPEKHSTEGVFTKIDVIAEALKLQVEAEYLKKVISTKIELVQEKIENLSKSKQKKLLFVYARGKSVLNVSGTGTSADAMISLVKGVNVANGFEGYKPLTTEALVSFAPEIIVLTRNGIASIGGVEGILNVEGVSLTPAGKNKNFVIVDDLAFLGFTPRISEILEELADKVYSEQ